MATQLSLFLEDEIEKGLSIYEIYMLDSSSYPHVRRYHSHIKFVMAASEDEAATQEQYLFEAARKDKEYLDIKKATREDVIRRSLILEGQLEACYEILQEFA